MQGSSQLVQWTRNTASFTITLEPPSNCTCISSRMLSNSRCESFAVSTVLMTRNNPGGERWDLRQISTQHFCTTPRTVAHWLTKNGRITRWKLTNIGEHWWTFCTHEPASPLVLWLFHEPSSLFQRNHFQVHRCNRNLKVGYVCPSSAMDVFLEGNPPIDFGWYLFVGSLV